MNVTELTIGLLTYYVGTDSIVALLTDQRGQTKRFRLPNCRDVFPLIDHFVAVLEQPVAYTPTELAAAFREFVHGWGRQLLPPAGDLDPFDVLVIVPHHFLHGLPLHIVSQPDGTSLAARYGVTYCSSGTLFARCVDRNRARFPNPAIEAAAGPANGDPAGPARPPRTCLSLGLDVLTDKDPAYRALAATFASHFQKVQPVTTRDEVKDSLDVFWSLPDDRRPDVICLVSHGYADPATPDRSGLLIAGRRGVGRMRRVRLHRDTVVRIQDYPFADVPLRLDPIRPQPVPVGWFDPEPLTIGELKVNCSTDAELIALLGCSTGSGQVASADDHASLAYQWLKAGAASVLANLWEADLPFITRWTEIFVANWTAARRPKAIAARDSTRILLSQHPDLADRPHVWGSLALFGDWL